MSLPNYDAGGWDRCKKWWPDSSGPLDNYCQNSMKKFQTQISSELLAIIANVLSLSVLPNLKSSIFKNHIFVNQIVESGNTDEFSIINSTNGTL